MSNAPLMPMATAVWLVENTTLTFKQIANFCKLHEVEIQGIADGEVAKGIKAYNPIISGQLTKEEIELSSKDQNRPLQIKSTDIEISNSEKKIKKYIPLSKRQDKPDSALWLIKQHNILKDSQIAKLVGITKNSDIFKCAINYVGVVDLYTLYDDKQWMFADMGRPQQHIEMGNPNTERDILEKASPINYVENIKGDLFVIHGRQDRQASYKQVLQLKEALEDADIPFEYMIKGDEGHGFYSEANNLELYERMISFLETNLN